MPLISVIIPAYNAGSTIADAIESVLNQSLSDFELIVIDDGSTDSTLNILSEIKDCRLKVFAYSNAGVSASRNRGIARAKGDFIAFLDADDLWIADKLECQFNALQENPQAALAYSWTDYIDESAQFSHPGDRVTASGNVYEQLLIRNFLDNGSNALVRKSALLQVSGFDESLSYGEDWELWLRLAALYPFVAVPRPQVLYRMSASAASADTSQMEARALKVIERVFDQVPETLQHLKKYRLSNFYQYLTFRTLEKPLLRQKGIAAARYLWLALKQDPSLLKRRATLIVKVSLKIAAIVLFSTPPSLAWLDKLRPPTGKKELGSRSASDR